MNSSNHTGQENVWFVECSTSARGTPASEESAQTEQNASIIDLQIRIGGTWLSVNSAGYFWATRKKNSRQKTPQNSRKKLKIKLKTKN